MTSRLILILTLPLLDQTSTAHRKYKKDLDLLKPDIIAYNIEKERALGLEPGTLVTTEEGGRMVLTAAAKEQAIMLSGISFHHKIHERNILTKYAQVPAPAGVSLRVYIVMQTA